MKVMILKQSTLAMIFLDLINCGAYPPAHAEHHWCCRSLQQMSEHPWSLTGPGCAHECSVP